MAAGAQDRAGSHDGITTLTNLVGGGIGDDPGCAGSTITFVAWLTHVWQKKAARTNRAA